MKKQILVIGGGLAGIRAATTASRQGEDVSVKLFTREEVISFGRYELPLLAEFHDDVDILIEQDRERLKEMADIDIFYHNEVLSIHTNEKSILVNDMDTNQEIAYEYDSLIICTGTTMPIPALEGIHLKDIFFLNTLEDAVSIGRFLKNNIVRKAVVSGGGIAGIQMLEQLWHMDIAVILVDAAKHILPELDVEVADLVKKSLEEKSIEILTEEKILTLIGNLKGEVVEVHTLNHILPVNLVVWTSKPMPEILLAKEAGIDTGVTGAINVNELLETNMPSIYSAGDCTEISHMLTKAPIWNPTRSCAINMGSIAGLNASQEQRKESYKGALGTFSIYLFDLIVSKTGLSFHEAKENGYDPVMVLVPIIDQAVHDELIIMLIADRKTRRLLGLQSIGGDKAEKVVDIAATAISMGAGIDDFNGMDLSNSLIHSSSHHPIVRAAQVLINKLDGRLEGISPAQLSELMEDPQFVLIDLRTTAEVMLGTIPQAKHIPFDELNARMNEINLEKRIVLICKDGRKAYNAYCFLKRSGYENVSILDGGIASYPYKLV